MVPLDSRWIQRLDQDTCVRESSGGGGGSRTRVRKRVVVGLYMRVRFVIFVPGVWKRLSTARP